MTARVEDPRIYTVVAAKVPRKVFDLLRAEARTHYRSTSSQTAFILAQWAERKEHGGA